MRCMRDCITEVERDKLFSLPEDQRGDSQLKHGDLHSREAVQGTLERADESTLDLLHLSGVEEISEVLGGM